MPHIHAHKHTYTGSDYHDVKDQLEQLPPLMQYETLQQLKEERRASNRGVFTAVKDDPDAYSVSKHIIS